MPNSIDYDDSFKGDREADRDPEDSLEPTKLEILLEDLKRLKKWWLNDASYRAPEDHLQSYALGCADMLETIIRRLES